MRLLQIIIPDGKYRVVLDLLEKKGLDYVVSDETDSGEYDAIVYAPVPTSAVGSILDALQDEGIDRESHAFVVDAETVVSDQFEDTQQEHTTDTVDEEQISRQELITRAEDLTPAFSVFLTMTIISTIVATVGLLLDSPAVVVGSMVIAPLIGPALAASIGTVVNERELLFTGIRYQFVGVISGITAAAVFAWILQSLLVVPPGTEITQINEIAERITPELLLLPVALGAGIAGVLSLATGFSVAIVGVMIAAALIPPMAAAGISLAWGLPGAAVGSTALVFINLLGVNLAGLLTVWYIGYRPVEWFEIPTVERHVFRQVTILTVVIFGLSLFLGSVTYTSYQMSTFEETATIETEAVLEDYEEAHLLEVRVEVHQEGFSLDHPLDATQQIDVVVIEIGGPPGTYDPELIETLHERINEHTTGEVAVQVRFVTSGHR